MKNLNEKLSLEIKLFRKKNNLTSSEKNVNPSCDDITYDEFLK